MPGLSLVTLVVLCKGVRPCLQMSPATGWQPPRSGAAGYWYPETLVPAELQAGEGKFVPN